MILKKLLFLTHAAHQLATVQQCQAFESENRNRMPVHETVPGGIVLCQDIGM